MELKLHLSTFMYLCVYFIIVFESTQCSQDACESKLCICVGRTMICNQVNTSYIPKPPNSIYFIKFENGFLPSISLETFKNVIHMKKKLKGMTLTNNSIREIAKSSLKMFTHLAFLDVSNNELSLQSVYNLVSDLKFVGRLHSLNLDNTGLDNPPSDIFNQLSTSYLTRLDISGNNFPTLNFSMFKPIPKLSELNVANSKVEIAIVCDIKNLQQVDLNSNRLREIPNFCDRYVAMTPSLQSVKFRKNMICRYSPEHLNCLTNLKNLNLQDNCIVQVGSGFFSKLKSLNVLELSNQKNPYQRLTIKNYAFNNSKLQSLRIDGNGIFSKFIDPMAFAGCSNLDLLDLCFNHLSDYGTPYSTKLNKILSYVTSISELNLSYDYLHDIPTAVQGMKHLKTLFYQGNFIKSWPSGFFDRNANLNQIDFADNKIETVKKDMFDLKMRKKLKIIEIGLNPLVCDCQLVWFMNWVRKERNKFTGYPEKFACTHITESSCLKNNPVHTALITVCSIVISVFLLVVVGYKYRWNIKYQIYIWRHQPKLKKELNSRTYEYDIFVTYCSQDSNWVLDLLLPKLEEEENLKLCVHERDFKGGQMIIDNIVESMDNSRRVLVVLSNESAKSEWCQFEMNLAQKKVLNENIAPLTVVLLEDIDSENMTSALSSLLKTTTYITYDELSENSHLFWNRLKRSLN